jgi:hypothetical protein
MQVSELLDVADGAQLEAEFGCQDTEGNWE